MSIYRRLIIAVAAMGLATSVFAADEAATTATTATTETTAAAPADAAPTTSAEATPATTDAAPAATAENKDTANTTAVASVDKLDVNKASAKDLMKLKGMSASKAKAIVSYRKKHGDFKSLDDLREVKGFKKLNEKKFQEIQEQLTLG